jgi:CheY-like chemotaxis protein
MFKYCGPAWKGYAMSESEFLTTGEAAKMLKVSRSTVSRKYDQGLLRGQTNSITGERMIHRDSVVAFMRKHNMSSTGIERRSVLVCTPNDKLFDAVNSTLGSDGRMAMERVPGGCDALVATASTTYHLVMVDEQLPDIVCDDVLKTVRKSPASRQTLLAVVTHTESNGRYAEHCDAVVSANRLVDPTVWSDIYKLLGLSAVKTTTRKYEYDRQWPRSDVDIPVHLSIYKLDAPSAREKGKARIVDISCGGAQLTDLEIESGSLPATAYRMVMEVKEKPLAGWRAHAQVVRLHSGGKLTLGVQFVKLAQSALEQIKKLVSDS